MSEAVDLMREWIPIIISTFFIASVISIPIFTVIMTPTRTSQTPPPPPPMPSVRYRRALEEEEVLEKIAARQIAERLVGDVIRDCVEEMPIIRT